MITIVLAEDHQIVREGFRSILQAEPDYAVVGEAGDGLEAVREVERLRPDVLVLDLMLPALNGLEVARQVHQRVPDTKIVVLSMHENEAYVLEALRNGASGYVLKSAGAEELKRAVREVIEGRRYLSGALSERAIEAYVRASHEDAGLKDTYAMLTSREREVLQLTAEGCTSREVADHLSISPRTAEKHRSNLMAKLGLHSQVEVIHYAIQRGLISPAQR